MSKYSRSSGLSSGFVHLLTLLIVISVAGGVVVSANVTTTREYPVLTYQSKNVLGEDEAVEKLEEQAKEAEKKTEEQQKEAQKTQEEQNKEAENKQTEQQKVKEEATSLSGVKSKIQADGKKSETEIETPDGQKIKTKIEDNGTTKVEIEHGQLKLKYVVENGVIKLRAENESGQEVELEDDELDELENEIEEELEDEGIKIATGSGKPIFAKNNIAATTDFPLSVDVGTNQLIVNTPAGQKVVTILPDRAVQNLLATNVINKIESQPTDSQVTSELSSVNGVVKLEIRGNEVIYKVKGVKTHNLLGFIAVNTPTTAFVSAQSGDLVAQEQSLLTNIIDLLSP